MSSRLSESRLSREVRDPVHQGLQQQLLGRIQNHLTFVIPPPSCLYSLTLPSSLAFAEPLLMQSSLPWYRHRHQMDFLQSRRQYHLYLNLNIRRISSHFQSELPFWCGYRLYQYTPQRSRLLRQTHRRLWKFLECWVAHRLQEVNLFPPFLFSQIRQERHLLKGLRSRPHRPWMCHVGCCLHLVYFLKPC